jgi:hypothetical protein
MLHDLYQTGTGTILVADDQASNRDLLDFLSFTVISVPHGTAGPVSRCTAARLGASSDAT